MTNHDKTRGTVAPSEDGATVVLTITPPNSGSVKMNLAVDDVGEVALGLLQASILCDNKRGLIGSHYQNEKPKRQD